MLDNRVNSIKYHRIRIVAFWLLVLLLAGVFYVLFVTATGIAIPCVFHETTGLWCPGCGTSRMFLKISKADFSGAFYANRFLFSTLVFLLAAIALRLYQFIKQKPFKNTVWFVVFLILYFASFLIYGVLRNLGAFSFLAPM